jgi:hypothetical protein
MPLASKAELQAQIEVDSGKVQGLCHLCALYQALHTIVKKPSLQTLPLCPQFQRRLNALRGPYRQLMLRCQAHNSDVGAARLLSIFPALLWAFLVDDSFNFHCLSSGGAASPVLETSRERLVP